MGVEFKKSKEDTEKFYWVGFTYVRTPKCESRFEVEGKSEKKKDLASV